MAKGLARFEEFAEKLVEGAFKRLRGRWLEPVEMAHQLSRAMEDNRTIGAGKIFVPNVYRVGLHPETFQQFVSFKEPLEQELASYLAEEAEIRGFEFVGRPHVVITVETGVSRGRLTIAAELAGEASPPVNRIDATQAILTDELRGVKATAPPSPREQLQLVIDQRIIPLDRPPISIGRSLDNDVILQDATVSRRHAQMVFRHGRWLLRDLHSTHGTQVNGHPVEECVLRPGDTITFGGVVVRVQAPPDAEPPPEPERAP